ncbi:hypothetical protein Patl1_13515 [Pistacia atlantica]|uniref:Uncharacterized protein n=1 Tax=Pistacia atlantica TaxID=434234 RepID=A0ACC1AS19_9ROSI|nr:hypothetical protein Patl1_13515 [Pistacia atlantica]
MHSHGIFTSCPLIFLPLQDPVFEHPSFSQTDIVQLEDEGISDEIKKLAKRHHEQVSKKQGLLDKLLKSASEVKELQEK